jgi:CheY-like chemotaxis protein
MKILVVDDDVRLLYEIVSHLQDAGHTVTKAWGGKEGVHAFKHRSPFDCVVTDYDMPDINGVDLALEIRKVNLQQRIIIFTGSDTLEATLPAYELTDIKVVSKKSVDGKTGLEILTDALKIT